MKPKILMQHVLHKYILHIHVVKVPKVAPFSVLSPFTNHIEVNDDMKFHYYKKILKS